MGWIFYSLFISFAAPILIGFWLANRAQLGYIGVMVGALTGLILMIAILYITELQIDLYMWKVYMPDLSASGALGADWIIQAFGRALRTLTISYVFFLMVFCIRVFLRGRAAQILKTTGGVQ